MDLIRSFGLLATLTFAMTATAQVPPAAPGNGTTGAIETTVDGKPVVKLGFGGRKAGAEEKKKKSDTALQSGATTPTMAGGPQSLSASAPTPTATPADAPKKAEKSQLRGDSKLSSDAAVARAKQEEAQKQREAEAKAKITAAPPAAAPAAQNGETAAK